MNMLKLKEVYNTLCCHAVQSGSLSELTEQFVIEWFVITLLGFNEIGLLCHNSWHAILFTKRVLDIYQLPFNTHQSEHVIFFLVSCTNGEQC